MSTICGGGPLSWTGIPQDPGVSVHDDERARSAGAPDADAGAAGGSGRCRRGRPLQEGAGFAVRAGFLSSAGIFLDSAKLSLYDSSHLTAVAPAGKLEPELVNFVHTQLHTHKDCSWHVR